MLWERKVEKNKKGETSNNNNNNYIYIYTVYTGTYSLGAWRCMLGDESNLAKWYQHVNCYIIVIGECRVEPDIDKSRLCVSRHDI